jgi:hypothetical protein
MELDQNFSQNVNDYSIAAYPDACFILIAKQNSR